MAKNLDEKYIAVLITAATAEEAEKIAGELIRLKLAACCNIIDGISSIYEWEGRIEKSGEAMIIAKSRAELFPELEKKVKELHSYDLPEIIAIPIVKGSADYLGWITKSTTQS